MWSTDLSYIPMDKGFEYVVAIMGWYSRKILSWRVSNSMDTDFCIDALEGAISRYGAPDFQRRYQNAQFTSEAFTSVLKAAGIQISMDGKGGYGVWHINRGNRYKY